MFLYAVAAEHSVLFQNHLLCVRGQSWNFVLLHLRQYKLKPQVLFCTPSSSPSASFDIHVAKIMSILSLHCSFDLYVYYNVITCSSIFIFYLQSSVNDWSVNNLPFGIFIKTINDFYSYSFIVNMIWYFHLFDIYIPLHSIKNFSF